MTFLVTGVLNIAGTPQAPITVELSSIAAPALASTINISYANVILSGPINAVALTAFNIGNGGTLTIQTSAGLSVGSTINFTGASGNLVFGSGFIIPLFGGISGFAPGKTIDITATAASQLNYVDAPGTNTGGTLTLLDTNGRTLSTLALKTGNFVTSDFHLQPDGNGGSLVNFDAVATGVTTTPFNATVGPNGVVGFVVTTSKPVLITGSPMLVLSDGGTATYDAGQSTGTRLVFTYTVGAGENSSDLAVTGVSTNGASLSAVGGGDFDLSSAVGNPDGILVIDTTPPTIATVTADQPNAHLAAGASVVFTINVTEPVVLAGGSPTLTLTDGGTATYDAAASSGTKLIFRHTVMPGQNATDLAITAINLNGASAIDAGGNALDLSAAVSNPDGTLVIDTTPPYETSIAVDAPSNLLTVGQVVKLTVTLNEPITLTGAPTLTLNDGGIAQLDAAHSTATSLVFLHTVQAGNNSAALSITGASLNGGTATDAVGNRLDLNSLVAQSIGTLTVDTRAPFVTGVTIDPSSGSISAGQTVAINVALSEAILPGGGTPVLTLNDNGTAIYDPVHSTSTLLAFTYTVQPGENTPDLAVTGVSMTGSPLTDAAGNALDFSGAAKNPSGILAVDTTPPTATSVRTNPGSGVLAAGQAVAFTFTLGEPVILVGGNPSLALSDGGTAIYDPLHSTATSLVFNYMVQPGRTTSDLAITGVSLNGATIADAAGNAFDLGSLLANPSGVLAVDAQAPVVTSVTTNPGSGALTVGQTVAITVSLSKPLHPGGGTPTLALNDGGTATFDAANSTATSLVFTQTIQPGYNSSDLAITGATIAGTPLTDMAGNVLDLAGAVRNPSGILVVDTTAPTVINVTTNPSTGVLTVGQSVSFSVSLSKPLVLTGGAVPTLTLSDGGTAVFDAANSTPTRLLFTHVVQAGQNTADLAVISVSNAGTPLTDAAGNALNLAAIIGNPAGTLGVDTTPPSTTPPSGVDPVTGQPNVPLPSILGVATTPGSGSLVPGQSFSITITTATPISVSGGVPVLALSDGGFAVYDPTRSSPTMMVFSSIVEPGQLTDALAIVGYDLNGATIADAVGQNLSLAAAQVTTPGNLAIVALPPVTTPVVTIPTTTAPTTTPVNADPVVTDPTPIQAGVISTSPTTDPSNGGIASGISPTATPSTLNVYRFFDSTTGTHFYTTSASERASIIASRPDLIPEGQDGIGLRAVNPAAGDPAAKEVFRFFDTIHGTQFLTASQDERDSLINTRPDLLFEPQGSFFEHVQPQAGDTPVFRFFSSTDGTHFYTDNAAERANIIQTRPDLIAEGIGFYEPS